MGYFMLACATSAYPSRPRSARRLWDGPAFRALVRTRCHLTEFSDGVDPRGPLAAALRSPAMCRMLPRCTARRLSVAPPARSCSLCFPSSSRVLLCPRSAEQLQLVFKSIDKGRENAVSKHRLVRFLRDGAPARTVRVSPS